MQDQNASPKGSPPENVPLEERGSLTRVQLYTLLAVLSLAVLGLCGYIVWDYYQTEDNTTTQPTASTTAETEEETGTSSEIAETTEETSETTTDEAVPLQPTSFTVEYWKGDGGVLDLVIDMPEDTTVSLEGTSATAYTTISYEDFTLTFGIPHFGLNETYSEYAAVTNPTIPSLYRVLQVNGSYEYITDLMLEGTCSHPTDIVVAPCGSGVIKFSEQDGVSVVFDGQVDSLSLADKMVGTLKLAE